MTDQIERCLCGGECSERFSSRGGWYVWCGMTNCLYQTPFRSAKPDAIATHNRMMLAARAPAEDIDALRRHAAAMTTQADLAHQALLDERQRWETERQQWEDKQAGLQVQSDAYWRQLQHAAEHLDTVIAAHKQQIAGLTDALAPVEWDPGMVPTEPGWYAYQERRPGTDGYFAVDVIHVIDGDDGLVAEYPGGGEGTINHMARWLGPVVLPRKRGGK